MWCPTPIPGGSLPPRLQTIRTCTCIVLSIVIMMEAWSANLAITEQQALCLTSAACADCKQEPAEYRIPDTAVSSV